MDSSNHDMDHKNWWAQTGGHIPAKPSYMDNKQHTKANTPPTPHSTHPVQWHAHHLQEAHLRLGDPRLGTVTQRAHRQACSLLTVALVVELLLKAAHPPGRSSRGTSESWIQCHVIQEDESRLVALAPTAPQITLPAHNLALHSLAQQCACSLAPGISYVFL